MSLASNTARHDCGPLNHEGLAEEWVQLEKTLGFRPAVNLEGTVDQQRQVLEDGCAARDKVSLTKDLLDEVTATDSTVASKDGFPVPIRIYKPTSAAPSAGRPCAIYIHGGGWTLGSIQADDLFARMVARNAGHVVVSIDYRRAPEHAYPTASDDCLAVFLWTIAHITDLGVDLSKVYVTGNSAGGHLSAVTALRIVTETDVADALAAQILRIPLTCHPLAFPGTLPVRTTVPVYNDHAVVSMFSEYAPNKQDWTNPLVSPLLASDDLLKRLPPTYIDACSEDPLYDGGVAFAERLDKVGVPVKLFVLEGMPHGSYYLFPELTSSKAANKAVIEGTDWALAQRK
ncbi:carboxylic ester hydrolase activity protein [Sporothrix stenoceras]|uniref:Carboxylic ester hydrolase activity protein n=1 Tax=Sporothrix stenoceras TaxID=5173 RepID=A0ABR3ZI19_9PEZI